MSIQNDIELLVPGAFEKPHTERFLHMFRDAIYRLTSYVNVDQGYGPPDNWTTHDDMFYRAVNTAEGFACGGRALLFLTMLNRLGIKARYAGMWSMVDQEATGSRSHASVDVFIEGRWQAFDPHYNISFIDPSTRGSLGWKDIHTRVKSGLSVQVTTEGYSQDHFLNTDHLVNNYPVEEVCNHMVLGPSFDTAPELLSGWDGILHFPSKSGTFDVVSMVNAPHYSLLAVPPSS